MMWYRVVVSGTEVYAGDDFQYAHDIAEMLRLEEPSEETVTIEFHKEAPKGESPNL